MATLASQLFCLLLRAPRDVSNTPIGFVSNIDRTDYTRRSHDNVGLPVNPARKCRDDNAIGFGLDT